MLKKTLKTVAKLKFRAAEAHRDQLRDGAPLAAKLKRAIADLHTRAQDHDRAAQAARAAAQALQNLIGHPASPPAATIAKSAPKQTTTTAKRKPTALPTRKKPVVAANPTTTPVGRKRAVPARKASTGATTSPVTRKAKDAVTLADAMTHVLKAYQAAKAGGVNARRLHTDVQTAGYVFGGNNLDNQMNYLNKTVRKHAARFKRGADGLIALA